jgi:DNA polymerase elongation subunit (family B)
MNYTTATDDELQLAHDQISKEITQLHNSQMSIKILMNGLYGSTANKHFIYYINDMAQAITTSGQLSVKWAGNEVNEYLNKVLKTDNIDYVSYTDTDSIYVNLGPLVERTFGTMDITREQGEEFLDKVCKHKLEPLLDRTYEELADRVGAYRNAMKMKREKISDKTIFVAKKRYIMSVLNSEGVHYDEPKVSVTGIDAARSSTPDICKKRFMEVFKVIVNEGEESVQKFISDFKEEFCSLPIEDISKVSGTNNVEGYADKTMIYKKGCPIHIRGCLVMNRWVEDSGLADRYTLIGSGDKVKFIYLKMPNPLREDVVAFIDAPPEEIDLDLYADKEKQFEKVFLGPLQKILDALGWSGIKVANLESFFS